MLVVNIDKFQYDIGIQTGFNEDYYDKFFELDRTALKENGHLEYILKIYSNGALLDSNTNQAYHPPLNHIISATFLRMLDLFGVSNKFKIEALEFPPLIYSILILIVVFKIMQKIGLSKKQIILPFSIIVFHPIFIYMSRLINNDQLVTLFTLISILYLLKWYENPSHKNTIMLAFSIGLGAMTKTSIIVMVIPLIFTYLKRLNEYLEDSSLVKKIILEGLLFAIISLPMVFWYPIRNAIKFEQPLFSIRHAFETLKVANTDFSSRWIINREIFDNSLLLNASNVWSYVINSSIIFIMDSEFIPVFVTLILKILSILFILISIISIVKETYKSENKKLLYILIVTYLSWIVGFIYFNISLPYSCTMHVRYVLVAMIIGIIYIGILYNNLKNTTFKYLLKMLIILFEVISILMFIYIIINFILISIFA